MAVFVVLAVALMVIAAALAVVTAWQFVGTVRRFAGRVRAIGEQFEPALTDIQRELEVAGAELEALEARMQGGGRQGAAAPAGRGDTGGASAPGW